MNILKNNTAFGNAYGYSLISTAIFIVIVGLFSVGAIQLYNAQENHEKISKNKAIEMSVKQALENFRAQNDRYPCPAPMNAAPDSATFGKEIANCDNPATPTANDQNWRVAGAVGNVHMGTLPTRTLNIDDKAMVDAWGSRIVYAVTESYTNGTTANFNENNGGITILDASGNDVTNGGDAIYAIVLPGSDKRGTYDHSGNKSPHQFAEASETHDESQPVPAGDGEEDYTPRRGEGREDAAGEDAANDARELGEGGTSLGDISASMSHENLDFNDAIFTASLFSNNSESDEKFTASLNYGTASTRYQWVVGEWSGSCPSCGTVAHTMAINRPKDCFMVGSATAEPTDEKCPGNPVIIETASLDCPATAACAGGPPPPPVIPPPPAPSSSYAWRIGNWGDCSCSSTRTRRVICVSESGRRADPSLCPQPRPIISESCTRTRSCSRGGSDDERGGGGQEADRNGDGRSDGRQSDAN